jgi:hypothetical protein
MTPHVSEEFSTRFDCSLFAIMGNTMQPRDPDEDEEDEEEEDEDEDEENGADEPLVVREPDEEQSMMLLGLGIGRRPSAGDNPSGTLSSGCRWMSERARASSTAISARARCFAAVNWIRPRRSPPT